MPVNVETPIATSTANGVTTVFPYNFTVLSSADLIVTGTSIAGVITIYTLGVDYTISGVGTNSGAATFLVAPSNGVVITMFRSSALNRATDYQTNGDLIAETLDLDFDRIWLVLQEQQRSQSQTIRVPEASGVTVLPVATSRANNLLGFDSNGNVIAVAPTAGTATALSASLAASTGTSLLGWLRAGVSAVLTTLQKWLGWQEINAFEFMTIAQIADYQSGAATIDLSSALQAWINACAASATSGGKLIGRLPPGGGGRVGTTLTVPGSAALRGHGVNSSLKGWGVPIFQITGDHAVIEDMALFAYTNAGAADPRAQSAITTNGTLGSPNNYGRVKRVYFQGWNRAIDFSYMWSSVTDDVTTVNCNFGIRYFGQCVNNAVQNSRLVVNSGTTSIQTSKDVGNQGEGLMVTNCLLSSGANAFLSDGFLSAGFYNCICDLLSGNAFDVNSVVGLTIDCPWVYSAQRCINFQALGSALNVDANISIGLAQTTGVGQSCVVVGANNNGIVFKSGTYVLTNAAGGLPFILSGGNIVVGPIICRNATTNSDINVNNSSTRISQEAILPNGIQWAVSPIRSVVSAATTVLPVPTGSAIERITITGNTNSTLLNDPAVWTGKIVVLVFTGTPTWSDGGNLKLSANFIATADDTLTLVSDGTNWNEIARSAN